MSKGSVGAAPSHRRALSYDGDGYAVPASAHQRQTNVQRWWSQFRDPVNFEFFCAMGIHILLILFHVILIIVRELKLERKVHGPADKIGLYQSVISFVMTSYATVLAAVLLAMA